MNNSKNNLSKPSHKCHYDGFLRIVFDDFYIVKRNYFSHHRKSMNLPSSRQFKNLCNLSKSDKNGITALREYMTKTGQFITVKQQIHAGQNVNKMLIYCIVKFRP